MGKSEHHDVLGRLDLHRHWTETSSTHVETFDNRWLEPGPEPATVTLVHAHGTKNFIKGHDSSYREDRYTLSAQTLASLIEQHAMRS